MKSISTIVVISFILFICGCSPKAKNNKIVIGHALNDTTGADSGWGADFKFDITKTIRLDTVTCYQIETINDGGKIGLEVDIPTRDSKKDGFGSGIALKSRGGMSDLFLRQLSQAYKVKLDSSRKFVSSISLIFVDLDKFAKSVEKGEIAQSYQKNYKLFFEDQKDSDDGEAELFLVISEKDKTISLNEKDTEYRPLIIKYLSKR